MSCCDKLDASGSWHSLDCHAPRLIVVCQREGFMNRLWIYRICSAAELTYTESAASRMQTGCDCRSGAGKSPGRRSPSHCAFLVDAVSSAYGVVRPPGGSASIIRAGRVVLGGTIQHFSASDLRHFIPEMLNLTACHYGAYVSAHEINKPKTHSKKRHKKKTQQIGMFRMPKNRNCD